MKPHAKCFWQQLSAEKEMLINPRHAHSVHKTVNKILVRREKIHVKCILTIAGGRWFRLAMYNVLLITHNIYINANLDLFSKVFMKACFCGYVLYTDNIRMAAPNEHISCLPSGILQLFFFAFSLRIY